MKQIKVFITGLCFLSVCLPLFGRTVGSNTASSRQLKTFFPASDDDNLMRGFAVFERGLTLEDATTECSFDAFFPVAGDVTLCGGTLTLLRDMELKNPFALGPGTIDADLFALEFPGNVSGIDIPTAYHTDLFCCVDTKDVGRDVESVSWSHDDQYVAVGSLVADGHDELQIYYFDGSVLTATLSVDLGVHAHAVRWHPSDYYLAVGKSGGTELEIYYLNVSNGTLESKGTADIGRIYALAWDPTGDYLAVGRNNKTELLIYDVASGVPGTSYSATYSSFPSVNRTVQKNAIDWDSTGSYIAVGLNSSSADADLKIFEFTGSAVSENAELEVGNTVFGVKWAPTGSVLAIAQNTTSNRLRLYDHDGSGGTLTEIESARVNDGQTIYGIDWSYDGLFLSLAKRTTSSTHQVRTFHFDSTEQKLSLVSGESCSSHVKSIAWANTGYNFVTGNVGDDLKLFSPVERQLVFKDARLFFKSDVTFRGPVVFEGTCLVNGSGNTFDFADSGAVIIAAGSSLVFEDAIVKGITANKIACADNDGLIMLRDVTWHQDSTYTFSVGALQFQNDVLMSGDAMFVYSTSKTSTLLAKSELELDVGFTFSYDPGAMSKTLFELEADSSKLTLNGATFHTTVTGLELTKGQLRVTRDSTLSSETKLIEDELEAVLIDEGITFGNSVSDDDFSCDVYSGATLMLSQGTLNYKNVNASSLELHNISSALHIGASSTLNLYESMDLGAGKLVLGDRAIVAFASQKTLTGSIQPLGKHFEASI